MYAINRCEFVINKTNIKKGRLTMYFLTHFFNKFIFHDHRLKFIK